MRESLLVSNSGESLAYTPGFTRSVDSSALRTRYYSSSLQIAFSVAETVAHSVTRSGREFLGPVCDGWGPVETPAELCQSRKAVGLLVGGGGWARCELGPLPTRCDLSSFFLVHLCSRGVFLQ